MTVDTRAARPFHSTTAVPETSDGDRRRWLPVDEHAVTAARDHVLTVLGTWEVDEDCIADAVLLTGEVVGNLVEHTGVRSVGLDVGATATRIVVDVRESGTTTVPAPDGHMLTDSGPGAAPRPGDLHGRGLLRMLDALSTEWGTSRAHRCTSTWFALTPSSAPPLAVVSPSAAAELDAVQSSLRRTQLLLRVTENLGRAVTAQQVGEVVTAHLRDHLGAVFTGIALVDAGEDDTPATMSYLDLSVFPQATRDRWARFELDVDAPVGAVVLTRTASYIENLADAEAEFPGLAAHMTTAGTHALAHLPLIAGGRSIGTLALAWGEPRGIDADTRALLTIVAGYAAQALIRFGTAAPVDPAVAAVIRAQRRLADAREEFDAAVAAGVPAAGLTSRDVEITRAQTALRSARSAHPGPASSRPVVH